MIAANSDRRQAVGLGNGRRHGSTIVVPTVEVVRGAARRLAIRRSRMANTTSRPTRCRIIEGPTLTQTDDLSSVPRSAQRRPQNNRARVIAANSDRRQAVGLGSGRHHGSTIVVPTVEVVPVLKSCGVRRAAGLDNVTQRPSRRLCFLVPKLRLGTQIPEALLRSSSAVAPAEAELRGVRSQAGAWDRDEFPPRLHARRNSILCGFDSLFPSSAWEHTPSKLRFDPKSNEVRPKRSFGQVRSQAGAWDRDEHPLRDSTPPRTHQFPLVYTHIETRSCFVFRIRTMEIGGIFPPANGDDP